MKKDHQPVELTDEQMENVNGGFKITIWEKPKFISVLLRLIYRVKPRKEDTTPDTVITGPIVADDDEQ